MRFHFVDTLNSRHLDGIVLIQILKLSGSYLYTIESYDDVYTVQVDTKEVVVCHLYQIFNIDKGRVLPNVPSYYGHLVRCSFYLMGRFL